VLIDGLEMNDPSRANRLFDFANLTTDNIDQIEILRGPQSILYGADAIGGVINIITKKGKGKPRFYIGSEGGSYETWREFGGASMGNDRLNMSLAFSHNSRDGFSAADDDLPGNSEDDKWENTSISSRLGFNFSENIDIDLITRFQKSRTHLDKGGGSYKDQKDYHANEHKIFTRFQVNSVALDGLWEHILAYGYADHTRDYRDDPYGDSDYDGKKHEISWQHNLYPHETNTINLGLEYEREEMNDHTDIDESAHTSSFFLQDQIKLKDFSFTTIGLRYDNHNEFGSESTFQIAQALLIRDLDTKFKGSFGTGFKSPSLYELYAPPSSRGPVGNSDLDPEESKGWDIGIEQSFFNNRLTIEIIYFYNDIDNLIDWDGSLGYINVNNAKTKGVESFIKLIPLKNLSLNLNFTYTDTKDDDGNRLTRRPRKKVGFNTFYKFSEKWDINLNILYVDKRDDNYWDSMSSKSSDVTLDDYCVVNLSGSCKFSEHIKLFGRIDNLFDEEYYEAYGYGTAGFSAYGGLKISF
jgi:vitamin B12 transporter